jgi:hypothetical protein
LLENLRGNPAGRAIVLQALDHLGLGRQERLEKLAQFLGRGLLLTGRLERFAVFADLLALGQKLLAARGRLRRRECASGHAATCARRWCR